MSTEAMKNTSKKPSYLRDSLLHVLFEFKLTECSFPFGERQFLFNIVWKGKVFWQDNEEPWIYLLQNIIGFYNK